MEKTVAPDSNNSNARPYGIFFSYLGVCLAVTVFVIAKLFDRTEHLYAPSTLPLKKHVTIFAALAACSLLSTWGFMFQYFQWSYDNWLAVRSQPNFDPSVKHWGLWLKETSLFKEAWQSVIVGYTRYWWSHQIFFFACALGLHLEWKGVRRDIKYVWAFMLLGQIVAISFATNLFLVTLLLSPQQRHAKPTAGRRQWLGPWLIDGLAILATTASAAYLAQEKYWYHPTAFMPLLLIPHAALLILPGARAILPASLFETGNIKTVDRIYSGMWILVISLGIQQLVQVTSKAHSIAGFQGIWSALFEHPAVSSVGFDVLFCWISWLCWWWVQAESEDFISQALSSSTSVLETKVKFDATTRSGQEG